jgi:hypothetical protein
VLKSFIKRGLVSASAVLAILFLAYLAGNGGARNDQDPPSEKAEVTAYPLLHFYPTKPEETRFGPLQFMGGLELTSKHPGFGGISSFRFRDDGKSFIAVTDVGSWMTGVIRRNSGKPVALDDVAISAIRLADGSRAKDRGLWDVESLALGAERAAVGIERRHTIATFAVKDGKVDNAGRMIPVPNFVKAWPSNRGIEAMAYMPKSSAYPDRLIGFSERSSDQSDLSDGFVMKDDGSEPFRFQIRRRDGFDITDIDFMPNGDLILLERYFSPSRGVGMRLRRIKTTNILPNAIIEPEILLTANNSYAIDNMEGLSIHRGDAGEILFTIVSDNNFFVIQRNLLLQFRWMAE